MKITIFTHAEEVPGFEQLMAALSNARGMPLECNYYETYDDFIKGFPRDKSQAVIVARRGADGMECARNAKLMRPSVPLVWLSNDNGFGVESYRIGCAFFSAEPLTHELLSTALARCKSQNQTT